jgi:hypothetical protein
LSVEDGLEGVRSGQDELAAAREEARERAVSAIRAVESALVEALQGEHLRGLPNLGTAERRFYGVRVRSSDENAGESVRYEERAVQTLIVAKDGQLAFARARAPDGEDGLVVVPARDEDLLAEDLEHVLRTVARVAAQHGVAVGRSTDRFLKISSAAARVLSEFGAGTRVPGPTEK